MNDPWVELTIGGERILHATLATLKVQAKFGEPMRLVLAPDVVIIVRHPTKIGD